MLLTTTTTAAEAEATTIRDKDIRDLPFDIIINMCNLSLLTIDDIMSVCYVFITNKHNTDTIFMVLKHIIIERSNSFDKRKFHNEKEDYFKTRIPSIFINQNNVDWFRITITLKQDGLIWFNDSITNETNDKAHCGSLCDYLTQKGKVDTSDATILIPAPIVSHRYSTKTIRPIHILIKEQDVYNIRKKRIRLNNGKWKSSFK